MVVSSGANPFAVGKVLGHADVASTARYSHLANATLLATVEAGAAKRAQDARSTHPPRALASRLVRGAVTYFFFASGLEDCPLTSPHRHHSCGEPIGLGTYERVSGNNI